MDEKKKKIKKPRGVAILIPGKCIACGARCQTSCPKDGVEMNDKGEPVFNAALCIGCAKCVKVCPSGAIEMFLTEEEKKQLAEWEAQRYVEGGAAKTEEGEEGKDAAHPQLKEYKGVWVFVEQSEGNAATVAWELLGIGGELAKKLNVELCAIVIGDNVKHLCDEAFSYGASKAYLVDDPVYKNYRTESYYKAVCHLVRKYKPEIVLVGATGLGRDLAGAVATDLLTGLTADCTGLAIDDKGFLMQTRPAFGGNIMATIMTERTRPQMSTVRPHVMPMPPCDKGLKGTIIVEPSPVKENDILVKVLQIIEDSRSGADAIDVSAADVIVSGGRGMLSKENFGILQELADQLGGVVGCSRAAVEAGYMPVERQVGQTGKTVRPKIYIACAISGAIQHLVGMQDSDVIIAVNRDHHAPIFEVATYGIVGDVFQVIPAITKRLKELKKQKVAC
ncbi:MAG: electron transfer flavoprotein subunit alpha [Dehalococcoidia bacterium]|jgi:electron transfer flavoprotein alpha subunit